MTKYYVVFHFSVLKWVYYRGGGKGILLRRKNKEGKTLRGKKRYFCHQAWDSTQQLQAQALAEFSLQRGKKASSWREFKFPPPVVTCQAICTRQSEPWWFHCLPGTVGSDIANIYSFNVNFLVSVYFILKQFRLVLVLEAKYNKLGLVWDLNPQDCSHC